MEVEDPLFLWKDEKRVTLDGWWARGGQSPTDGAMVIRAIGAAEAWIADPTEANQEACRVAETVRTPWAHAATALVWNPATTWRDLEVGARAAASLTSEGTVRKAICAALIEWALP